MMSQNLNEKVSTDIMTFSGMFLPQGPGQGTGPRTCDDSGVLRTAKMCRVYALSGKLLLYGLHGDSLVGMMNGTQPALREIWARRGTSARQHGEACSLCAFWTRRRRPAAIRR